MLTLRRSKIDAAVLSGLLLVTSPARAQLRLRGDALAETQSPVGLLVLHGEDRVNPWLDAETVSWLGTSTGGDVLTLSVRARDQATGSELRVGRLVAMTGALRPVHIDGARGLWRIARTTTIEGFGGVPVVPSFAWKEVEWTAGGRVAETTDSASVGASYAVRKMRSAVDDEEAGVDFALTPTRWLTAAGKSAFDLGSRQLADALVSLSAQNHDLRGELFATERTAGRFLPQTSLFSVLGDVPATNVGATTRWQAAPRLELVATGSVEARSSDVGGQGLARASLALDDAHAGALGLEGRRVDFGGARWVGVRTTASVPLPHAFRVSTELELVRPDDPRGGRSLWPWALAALTWRSTRALEVAAAVEASAASNRSSLDALGRLSYAFDAEPRR